MIVIKEIKAAETYNIRREVLRKGMTLSHKMMGDEDVDSLHLGVFESGRLVCVGSFMKADKPEFEGLQYQLRGMASAATSQGKGYGSKLLESAEHRLGERGADVLWCNARTIAVDFYIKQGYQIIGEMFDVDQVGPHYRMFKKLP